jgi:hypothetical protein
MMRPCPASFRRGSQASLALVQDELPCVRGLLPVRGRPLAIVGDPVPLVSDPVTRVRRPITEIRCPVAPIRDLLPLVRDPVALVSGAGRISFLRTRRRPQRTRRRAIRRGESPPPSRTGPFPGRIVTRSRANDALPRFVRTTQSGVGTPQPSLRPLNRRRLSEPLSSRLTSRHVAHRLTLTPIPVLNP